MEPHKPLFRPINEFNANLLLYSTNELALGSQVLKTHWALITLKADRFAAQDEALARADPKWLLHLIYTQEDRAHILYGSRNIPETLNLTGLGENTYDIKELNLTELIAFVYGSHKAVYETNNWARLCGKGTEYSQILIGSYLDLLCGGLTSLLPKNFDKGQDTELQNAKTKQAEAQHVGFAAEVSAANYIIEQFKQQKLNYMELAYKENLGGQIERFYPKSSLPVK